MNVYYVLIAIRICTFVRVFVIDVHCSHSLLDLPSCLWCGSGLSGCVCGVLPQIRASLSTVVGPFYTIPFIHFGKRTLCGLCPCLEICLAIRAISCKVTFCSAFYASYLVLALPCHVAIHSALPTSHVVHVPWDL